MVGHILTGPTINIQWGAIIITFLHIYKLEVRFPPHTVPSVAAVLLPIHKPNTDSTLTISQLKVQNYC